ncbi:hypothetical protein KSP40_PGU019932 [Platanthera guangdongensis]|uniref:Uncharacterized protein n=1 Tax=Platanthera guangdongensis TaxID=2320717 RepID=A0ABR2MDM5_9ASPA
MQDGTTSEPATLLHSSIFLLRERFRELQRMREMRERRELMRRLFSQAKYPASASTSFFFHDPQFMRSPRFRVDVEGSEFCRSGGESSISSLNSWGDETKKTTTNSCIETEIDTSLHL